jgi:SAM-dependent methyltransferase
MTYNAFKAAEIEAWDARAANYDRYTGQVTTRAFPTLLAMVGTAPGKRILDLCCGTGRAAGAAAALGACAEGIDASAAMVEAARAAFPNAAFATGDAEAIPRDTATFDGVVCSFGLMHVSSPEAMLAEIARVLKPGGRAALSHWVGPPESPLFRIVFGTMQGLADMTAVPPGPPPFALSSEAAMLERLESCGFRDASAMRLPLVFEAPEGKFAERFRLFAARAAMILDRQSDAVARDIQSAWEEQLQEFLDDGRYRIPMPAIAVCATRKG